jgi:hypothetical protein
MTHLLHQGQEQRCELEPPSFVTNVLPLTIGLAHAIRITLAPHIRSDPCGWPFPDRVLVWLLPTLESNVAHFHGGSGTAMLEQFKRHQLESIDKALFWQLAHWLDNQEPTLLTMVLDIIAALKQSDQDLLRWHEELSTVRPAILREVGPGKGTS